MNATEAVAAELVRLAFPVITEATIAYAARRAGVSVSPAEGRHARELAYRAKGAWRPAPSDPYAFLRNR